MTTPPKKHFAEVDIIKGVAILLVLLVHSGGVKYINMHQYSWYVYFTDYLRAFDMPLFFMVSGFLFANSGKKPFARVMKSKFDRLVVPYFVMSFLTLAVRMLTPALFNRPTGDIGYALNKIFFYGYWYWFIYTLFVLYVVFSLVRSRLNVVTASITIVILIIVKEIPTPHIGFLKIHQASYFGAFFLMGYVMRPYYDKLKGLLAHYGTILALAAIYVLGCYFCICHTKVSFLFNWVLPVSISLSVWGICIHLAKCGHASSPLSYCGKYSLQFYLFNGVTMGLSREILVRLLHIHQPMALMALMFAVTVLLSVVTVEIIRRIPKVRYLFGFGK